MNFKITSELAKNIYSGQIISYEVTVMPAVKLNWITEITQVKFKEFFIDEQRFGPYRMWHHEHSFLKISDKKTLVKDKVSYKIPLGILGHLAQIIFVKKQLTTIFNYRRLRLEEIFNQSN